MRHASVGQLAVALGYQFLMLLVAGYALWIGLDRGQPGWFVAAAVIVAAVIVRVILRPGDPERRQPRVDCSERDRRQQEGKEKQDYASHGSARAVMVVELRRTIRHIPRAA